jgi:hypothetical protein
MDILAQCDYCLKKDVEIQWPGIMIKQLERNGISHKDFYFCSKHCVIEFEKEEIETEE